MTTNPLAILSILSTVVFGMIWFERFPRFRKLGAAAGAILFMMVLSNLSLVPGESPVYDFFTGNGVKAAIVLILLNVDLRSIKSAGPTMGKAFFIGTVGSIVGAVTMGFILHSSLGENTHKLAGQFAATYIGGGVNFAAVGEHFGTSAELFTAGIAADVILTAFWLVACLAAPLILRSGSAPELESDQVQQSGASDHSLADALSNSGKPIDLVDLGALTAITAATMWSSFQLAHFVPMIPYTIWLTTLALGLAQLPIMKRVSGGSVIGYYLIIMFLACNGARSVIAKIVEVGPEVFYFAAGTVAIHGLVIFGVGRLMKIDVGTLAIASQANIGGSANAMAVATARGYRSRLLPGVAVGIIGTAIGNYIGLAVGTIMRTLL